MINVFKYPIVIILLVFSLSVFAQRGDANTSLIGGETYTVLKNEVDFNSGFYYAIGETTISYGLGLKYFRRLKNPKFALGLGYEKMWDTYNHKSVGFVCFYNPVNELFFSALTGFTFKGQSIRQSSFGFHAETGYQFRVKKLKIGPVTEIGYGNVNTHVSLSAKFSLSF